MKKQLLVKVMTTTALLSACVQPAFADVTALNDIEGSYAKDAILKLAEAGIINGTGSGNFNPTATISRQDFAIVLAKALDLNVTEESSNTTSSFTDVPADNYSYKYVEAAVKAGLIKGTGSGSFGYGQNLSRQDMAVLFTRALNQTAGKDVTTGGAQYLTFTDSSSIADYAKDAVGAAVELGLINGTGSGTFNPTGSATREQVALVANKFLDTKKQIEDQIAEEPTGETESEEPAETPAPAETTETASAGTSVSSGSSSSGSSSGSSRDTTAPTVMLSSLSPVTIGDSVIALSNEKGYVYLVPADDAIPTTITGLNNLVTANQAAKAAVATANAQTFLSTTGLPAGTYRAVAVDTAGNISAPSAESVELTESVPTLTSVDIASSTTVVLSYSQELDPAYVPTAYNSEAESDPYDLVVQAFDGEESYPVQLSNPVSISGSKVTLTLVNAVQPGDQLRVVYQPLTEEHALRSLSTGKEAVSFVQDVTAPHLTISLADSASFVVNPTLLSTDGDINLSTNNPGTYNKRSITSLIKVKWGQTEETISYNSTDHDFEIKDAGNNQVLGTVEVSSNSDNLTVNPAEGNPGGLNITALSGLTEEDAAALLFTLYETGEEPTEISLPVTIDQIAPTVTDSTYEDGKITLDLSEPLSFPISGSVSSAVQLEYSPSGNFDSDSITLEKSSDGYGINFDNTDSSRLIFTLDDQAIQTYGFSSGSFRITINGYYEDRARNLLQINNLIVPVSASQG
ncbi:S-layer homology domain-containing protein [Paenibacillus pinistramenti]|uniref:S-layer homology domain-containing protein n=1 Tax=Paenibacillus pinistramenti TaxID=1768003 RepID=UPI0013967E1A|nr:S-layer homology domain-containing protein [Paenibacillus pinistramenti]